MTPRSWIVQILFAGFGCLGGIWFCEIVPESCRSPSERCRNNPRRSSLPTGRKNNRMKATLQFARRPNGVAVVILAPLWLRRPAQMLVLRKDAIHSPCDFEQRIACRPKTCAIRYIDAQLYFATKPTDIWFWLWSTGYRQQLLECNNEPTLSEK